MTGSWRLIQDGVVGRLLDSEVEGEEKREGTQGGRGKKKILLRRRVRTDYLRWEGRTLHGGGGARQTYRAVCGAFFLSLILRSCSAQFSFFSPLFYPPQFSRQENVTVQAGRRAGRRRICLVLSVPMPRVKRKAVEPHTIRHSHNLTPHNTPRSPDKRVTRYDHELRRSVSGPGGERKTSVSATRVFLKVKTYMYGN